MRKLILAALLTMPSPCAAQVGAGPIAAIRPSQGTVSDHPYPGVIDLNVDATDTDHKIMRVRESLPIEGKGAVNCSIRNGRQRATRPPLR